MSGFQKLMKLFIPRTTFQKMEAESRSWFLTCDCGYSKSIWEIGGMRYKSKDNNKTFAKCPNCGKRKWLKLVQSPAQ